MKFHLFKRRKIPRKIELDDLARAFWQDPPIEKACSEAPDHGHPSTAPDWKTDAVRDFWLQYVRPFGNTITAPVLKTIRDLLMELETMAPCPSVSQADDETPGQYLALSGIALMDHALNVGREAVDLLKAKENDFQMRVGKLLIAALAHDVGKHPSARIAHMPHSYNSAMWLQQRIGHLKDRDRIIEAVRLHHAGAGSCKTAPANPILPILMQADRLARQKELANLAFEKQRQHSGSRERHQLTEDRMRNDPDHSEEKEEYWFSKEMFLENLYSQITVMGFDAFRHKGLAYFSPSVITGALNRLRRQCGLSDIRAGAQIRKIISMHVPEAANEKCRLRFKQNFKPMKRWFYIFPASLFGVSEKTGPDIPRDRKGRWLKGIDRIQAQPKQCPETKSLRFRDKQGEKMKTVLSIVLFLSTAVSYSHALANDMAAATHIIGQKSRQHDYGPARWMERPAYVITPKAAAAKAVMPRRRQSRPDRPVKKTVVIHFDFGSSELERSQKQKLYRLATIIGNRPAVSVTGYTCPTGPFEANRRLARERAQTVATWLKENGIAVRQTAGRPECCYVSDTRPAENRRVEIVF
jgi:outer membrane protein OmpA-like peptidoglycan-associated protein